MSGLQGCTGCVTGNGEEMTENGRAKVGSLAKKLMLTA